MQLKKAYSVIYMPIMKRGRIRMSILVLTDFH
jgi:hypothetical protein